MNGKYVKRGAYIAVALLVLLLFGWALQEKPILVETAKITRGDLIVTVEEDGKTRVKEVYKVSAPIAGRVDRSLLDVGDQVIHGKTVVATINPLTTPFMNARTKAEAQANVGTAQAAIALAQAQLASAKAEHKLAASELTRAQRLNRTKTISDAQLERVEIDVTLKAAKVQSAQAQIAQRQSDLQSAKARLIEPQLALDPERSEELAVRMISPINGVVLTLAVESEQTINSGDLLVELGDPSDIEVVVDLLSTKAVKIKKGAKANLVDWGGNTLQATVRRIDPAGFTKVSSLGIEEQRVNAILDLNAPAPQLGHGFHLRAAIETWHGQNVLRIPMTALFREGNDWATFKIVGGTAQLQLLTIGAFNQDIAEVTSGLTQNDTVIQFPGDTVSHGTAVVAE
ncbi:Macrolide export protein MacA [Pseudovibrio axinellae]|uniref:Macrolide export protein MacA n=1 Tax=Pseudovibrio axinellae TaxID=989403 RepID=A0A165XRJ7_9HYPH|nr:HlyD family efflux transporter periplasmic adaptor subunit [Pseudovibrio axinellae]KZL17972.1 Macrolide export protein MacA [Pseudovibrio axinellae]SER14872.1 HlyD family secretion protein [Pseudovibrio axinellae]